MNLSSMDPVANSIIAGCYVNGGVVYASGNGDYLNGWRDLILMKR